MPDDTVDPLIPRPNVDRPFSLASTYPGHQTMDGLRHSLGGGGTRSRTGLSWVVIASYFFDWAILVVVAAIGYILGNITPNKRPFSLEDRNISFPFTVHETVPLWLLIVCSVIAPIIFVAIISLIFVPGSTVPRGTPKSLIWKRKLWELHAGLLGLALSVVAAWFITQAMKNLFGKPRPDLLSRCQPDLANLSQYIVGGIANSSSNGQLVSADICKNVDKETLDDGFRSYPSGHSSSSAAGLIYLSLFIASKFAITIPFLAPGGQSEASSFAAFPSRMRLDNSGIESYELPTRGQSKGSQPPLDPSLQKSLQKHRRTVAAVRRQAAAPPIYLLVIALVPFFASVFIAGSRWFDFRHHGFDIIFGYLIGTAAAFFSFRYYHLPISRGAGWAWGPRSRDKAFWAGVGSYSYATEHMRSHYRAGDEEEALEVPESSYGQGNGLQHQGAAAGQGGGGNFSRPATGRKPQSLHDGRDRVDTEYMGNGTGQAF
ncbi:PAP2 superfamily-domain-containing protein [Bombardia bombarda]|uniref:PAP2 superfamily-domain-containing protein n=1 Tax=Bombardia bombarda TaxID=252184 RepID=A0AA40C867_9PEZI|nr:PAP2 superfamily-domain-containing protein [Bombardia bombarda]